MNEGVQLILKRMDSHPEEFYEDDTLGKMKPPGKWRQIMVQVRSRVGAIGEAPNRRYLPFLSHEEVAAIYDKWVSLQGPLFTDYVMRNILLEDAAEEWDPMAAKVSK